MNFCCFVKLFIVTSDISVTCTATKQASSLKWKCFTFATEWKGEIGRRKGLSASRAVSCSLNGVNGLFHSRPFELGTGSAPFRVFGVSLVCNCTPVLFATFRQNITYFQLLCCALCWWKWQPTCSARTKMSMNTNWANLGFVPLQEIRVSRLLLVEEFHFHLRARRKTKKDARQGTGRCDKFVRRRTCEPFLQKEHQTIRCG